MTRSGLPFDEPEPEPPPAPVRRVLSVGELTATLRTLVESEFYEVWVEGELSGARVWNTGHMYFTLKDAQAQLKGVMFRSSLRLLKFTPEDGAHVVARGRLSVYDPRGEYQLVCEHLEPKGLGALQLAYEQLRKRLAAEGLFDQARKRPLPALPRRTRRALALRSLGAQRSKRSSTLPSVTTSPGASAWVVTGWPLTSVPLDEPTSWRTNMSPSASTRACTRLSEPSATRISLCAPRPIDVSAHSSIRWPATGPVSPTR